MKNNRFVLGALIAIVVVAVLTFAYREYSTSRVASEQEQTSAKTSDSAALPAPVAEVLAPADAENAEATSAQATKPKPRLSYDAAVKQYGDRRIQLDASCNATPKEVTYKNGTQIMIDNRAAVSRKILFNTKSYTIPAYDYVILSASSTALPGVTYLDCGDKQNVARILIQK